MSQDDPSPRPSRSPSPLPCTMAFVFDDGRDHVSSHRSRASSPVECIYDYETVVPPPPEKITMHLLQLGCPTCLSMYPAAAISPITKERDVDNPITKERDVDSHSVGDVRTKSGPSTGSEGHPFSCCEACKYFWKTRGCKAGGLCDRCHICKYKRSNRRNLRGQ